MPKGVNKDGTNNIAKYNATLTPEQAAENRKAASAAGVEARRQKAKQIKDIKTIAKIVNNAPAGADLKAALKRLGIENENLTNAAGIVLAVYQAALNGDMKAVEKWESYIGQADKSKGSAAPFVQIVCDLPRPTYSIPPDAIIVEAEEVKDSG